MAKFLNHLKRGGKKRTLCFLIDDKVQSLTISNKPARGLDTGREIEKIKEAISYSTNFISYFPTKGKGKKKTTWCLPDIECL